MESLKLFLEAASLQNQKLQIESITVDSVITLTDSFSDIFVWLLTPEFLSLYDFFF